MFNIAMSIKDKKKNFVSQDLTSKQFCEVCFQNQPSTHHLTYLRCNKCLKNVHCYCYRPYLANMKQDSKTFMCDSCQHKQINHVHCNLCNFKSGILKKVGKSDGYVHVVCALLSDQYTVISYSKLQFKLEQNLKTTNSKYQEKALCFLCKKSKKYTNFVKCMFKDCQNVVHICCLKNFKRFQFNQWECVFQLLDKNNFTIKHMNQLGALFQDYPLPPIINPHQSKPNLVICPFHQQNQQEFIYCLCNKKIKQQQLIGCNQCRRWVHLSCSGVKSRDDYLKCFGCNANDIYSKRISLPEIIGMMYSIQQNQKKTIQSAEWYFIDRFPFSLSKVLLTKMALMKEGVFQHYIDILMENYCKYLPQIFKQKQQCLKMFNDNQFITWFYNLLNYQKCELQKSQVKTQVLIKYLQDCKIISQYSKNKLKQLLIIKLQSQQLQNKAVFQLIEDFSNKCTKNENLSTIIESLVSLQQILKQDCDQSLKIPKPLKILLAIINKGVNKNILHYLLQIYRFLVFNIQEYGIIQIPQIKYYRFHCIVLIFPQNVRNLVRELLFEYLKKTKPIRQCNVNNQLIKIHKNKINNEQTILTQIPKTNQKVTQKNIYSPTDPVYENFQTLLIYLNALKKQSLNIILQKQDSQKKDIQKIQDFLLNSKLNALNDCEKQIIKKYMIKQNFFTNIVNKYKELKNRLDPDITSLIQEIDMSDQNLHNFEKSKNVLKILQLEILSNASLNFATTEINKLANYNIQLNILEMQSIKIFCQGVLIKYQYEQKRLLKKELFLQVIKMIQYTNLSERFSFYKQQYELYRKCKFSLLKFIPFGNTLQNQLQSQQFKKQIQKALKDYLNFKFNVSIEIKKLKTLQLWCNITERFFQYFNFNKKQKPNIDSILHFKDILQISQYPKNQIYKIINQAYNQANQINIKLKRFLEKPRSQQLDMYEELTVYKNKIKISQAVQLLKILKESRLNVLVQEQELQIQINEYSKNIQNQNVEQKNTINQLNLFRNKLIKTLIRPDCNELYYNTISKISKLKCQNQQFSLNRIQFQKILNLSGNEVTQILENQKGYKLYKTFKKIQRAQKQCLNLSNKNNKHLLQLQDEKKILEQIMDDSERKIIQKWYSKAKKIKGKFMIYKLQREDEKKYKLLEQQSDRLPINLKQITDEITNMRKQCESIYLKLKKQQLNSYLFNIQSQLLFQSYRSIGMKHRLLEPMLEKFISYKRLLELSWGENPFKYKYFAIEFQKNDELLQIQKMKKIRFSYFHTMYKFVKQQNYQYPMMQLIRTIVQEGCLLIKHQQNAKIRQKILNIIIEVNCMQAEVNEVQQLEFDIQKTKKIYQEEKYDYKNIVQQKIGKIVKYQKEKNKLKIKF